MINNKQNVGLAVVSALFPPHQHLCGKICLPSSLSSPAGRGRTAFTMADRRSSRFHILGYSSAFTMAEILISLTIIGIIAAITLPSLRANINETTWNTQRKALYSRLSQAISMMPSLNGYGTYAGTWKDDVVTPTEDTAATTFVTDGLSKVLQINNICSVPMGMSSENARKELKKCGIATKIKTWENNKKIDFPTKLSELNPSFVARHQLGYTNLQKNIDTLAAAIETKNGESIAVFYNPYCHDFNSPAGMYYNNVHVAVMAQTKMCANFIYDLNGKKGPNTVGKDIGFITALYPTNSVVAAPILIINSYAGNVENMSNASFNNVSRYCTNSDKNSRATSIEELMSIFYNRDILGISRESPQYISKTAYSSDEAWHLTMHNGNMRASGRNVRGFFICVKR